MRSLQDYIDIYRGIANKLNITGDPVEVLSQMLANASFISEVENIAYAQEASLEKSTLINSKIQHCVDDMYSVFRGSCPRVILKIKPTRYLSFNIYDEIISSNSFKAYYLGYFDKNYTRPEGAEDISGDEGFVYSPITMSPAINETDTYTIICLIAKETVSKKWVLNQNNTYYVDCLENDLSDDFWVKVNGNFHETTRLFSSHILDGSVFDLTLPSFGSRLYIADIFRSRMSREETQTPANTIIEALYYRFSYLSDYNVSELKRLNIRGAEMVDFDSEWLSGRSYNILGTGLASMSEIDRDNLITIHYKANRDRYVNSILRSNSDIGTVLEETYPNKIISGGTTYRFSSSEQSNSITIYYVPFSNSTILTEEEKTDFINSKSAYYITDKITIERGSQYTAIFNLDVEIYQNSSIDQEVGDILENYSNKFDVKFNELTEEIKSLISKISNVKRIIDMEITYTNEDGTVVSESDVYGGDNVVYFSVDYIINSVIESSGTV